MALLLLITVWFSAIFAWLLGIWLEIIDTPSTASSPIFVFSSAFILGLGIFIGKTNSKFLKIKSINIGLHRNLNIKTQLVYCLCWFSLFGGIAAVSRGGGLSGNLQEAREIYLSANYSVSLLSYIIEFGYAIGLIGLSLIPWVYHKNKILEFSYVILGLTGSILISLSSGGRINILIAFLLILISYLVYYPSLFSLLRRISLRQMILVIIIFTIIFMFIYGLSYWILLRSQLYFHILVENQFKVVSDNLYSLGVKDSDINSSLTFLFATFIGQLFNGIDSFEPFMRVYEPHPLLGAYQFVFISGKIPGSDWFEWKDEIESCYRVFGLFDNVWGTYVREFVVDFGWYGNHLLSLMVGFLIGKLERIQNKKLPFLLTYIYSLTWVVMTPFYSILIFRPFQISFLIVFSLVILSLFLKQNSKSPRLYRDL